MKLSNSKLIANLLIYEYEYEENTRHILSRLSIQNCHTYSIPKYDTDWKIELVEQVEC